MGRRLRRARLEAGLSQRELCGETITRNMLSQIENGSAIPSLSTLQILAGRLKKPIGYFFGEGTACPEESPLEPAWQAFEEGDMDQAAILFEKAAPASRRERKILKALIQLSQAQRAAEDRRGPYAVRLLESVEIPGCLPELERRKQLLLAELLPERAAKCLDRLTSLDRELMIRARECVSRDPEHAGALLDAAQDRSSELWQMLRGESWLLQKQYEKALTCFLKAEPAYPKPSAAKLEICYRELGDFQQAYLYACRQRDI